MKLRVITWNLFHGRDAPPDRSLATWRSRLSRRPELGETHAQLNRELLAEFIEVLTRPWPGDADAAWDVALLQECPPRWTAALAEATGAWVKSAPTSRNSWGRLRAVAARLNPDLIASAEGGSNLTLARGPVGPIELGRELVVARRPERRVMAFAECASGLCLANLHATNDRPGQATGELLRAAETATRWAGGRPLIFGGDLNLRPGETDRDRAGVFTELADRFGLTAPTGPGEIDHLLARGLEVIERPAAWPAARREVEGPGGRAVRLSDHAPVGAVFGLP